MPLEPKAFAACRLPVRRLIVASLVASALLFVVGIARGEFGSLLTRLLLTAVGLSVGSLLAHVELKAVDALPRLSRTALALLLASQVFYYLLVWTPLSRDTLYWRPWWITMVASVTSAHLLALRLTRQPRNWVDRTTAAGALVTGAWCANLLLGRGVLRDLNVWLIGVVVLPALVSVVGSIVIWRRWIRRDGPPAPLPFWARASWVVGGLLAAFAGGWYVGGAGTGALSVRDLLPSALGGMPVEEVESQLLADFDRVKRVCTAVDDLESRLGAMEVSIRATQQAEGRTFYKPEEDDRIRWAFVTYLSHRAALTRIAATYAGFEGVREPALQSRCFMVGHAAGCAAFEAGLKFVALYRDVEPVRRKLNEPENRWGLPAGMFDRIYDSVTDERNLATMHEMSTRYDSRREGWTSIWPAEDYAWLDTRILRGQEHVKTKALSRSRAWLNRLTRRVKQDTYTPVYTAQSALSAWIGDTRITQDPPAITLEQIRAAASEMQPGDIILERRNWFLSNAFLPGFWPHGALYVGTADDIKRLGLAEHPEVKSRWTQFTRPGEPLTVIESVSEGVIFNSLSHSLHADHVAVLRPRGLKPAEIGEAIVRAFSHQGKPYDFEFDFFTSDKLVCTELVYRAYEGLLHFDLVRVMGRDTLPALDIARKFAKERGTPAAQLDFVLFLDAVPGEPKALRVGPEVLVESIGREKSFGR